MHAYEHCHPACSFKHESLLDPTAAARYQSERVLAVLDIANRYSRQRFIYQLLDRFLLFRRDVGISVIFTCQTLKSESVIITRAIIDDAVLEHTLTPAIMSSDFIVAFYYTCKLQLSSSFTGFLISNKYAAQSSLSFSHSLIIPKFSSNRRWTNKKRHVNNFKKTS